MAFDAGWVPVAQIDSEEGTVPRNFAIADCKWRQIPPPTHIQPHRASSLVHAKVCIPNEVMADGK
jgi:hypothetical protein